jgi:hypothetical protein
VARYLSNLAKYDYQLVYCPGRLNKADTLSQLPGVEEGKHDNEDVLVLPEKLFVQAADVNELKQKVLKGQTHTPDYFKELNHSHPFSLISNHWYHQQQPAVPENTELKWHILQKYHNHALAGHLGITTTL